LELDLFLPIALTINPVMAMRGAHITSDEMNAAVALRPDTSPESGESARVTIIGLSNRNILKRCADVLLIAQDYHVRS
jgi:hypothetical protein